MPVHQLNVSVELTDDEEAAICEVLGCQPAQLPGRLSTYGAAAMREYAEMFAGQAMTTATDLRERRLLAILLALLPNAFPTDDQIARMFNLTTSGARGLLRATMSKHRNRLRSALDTAARQFIAACQPSGQDFQARYSNSVVVQMLNDKLATAAQTRRPIARVLGTFDTYTVPNGSMIELRAMYP